MVAMGACIIELQSVEVFLYVLYFLHFYMFIIFSAKYNINNSCRL